MRARQLWFWPPPRPLVERLGADFFRQVPAAPAVYLLCGPGEGVLYVGKAKNLRRRLLMSLSLVRMDALSASASTLLMLEWGIRSLSFGWIVFQLGAVATAVASSPEQRPGGEAFQLRERS